MSVHGSRADSRSCVVLPSLALLLFSMLSTGCVERYLRIRTLPEGATVYVNGQYVGESPVDVPFDHYGDFQLDLWAQGRQGRTAIVPVEAPWYQITPLDLFSELLDPRTHVDAHQVEFELELRRRPSVQPGDDPEPQDERAQREGREMLERLRGEDGQR